MMQKIRPYWSAFRIRALLEFQYRGAALGGIITQGFFGLILIFLYQALYAGSEPRQLMETITYVWLQQMFFFALLTGEGEIIQQIMSGSVAYSLVRPVDQQLYWCCRDLAMKIVGVGMRLTPMLLLQFILPEDCRMLPPGSPLAFVQFFVSMLMGFLCLTEISSISQACVMITLDNRGLSSILNLLKAVLSGNVIPLTLFPASVQQLIRYQPFAQALDAPIRMYLNEQTAGEFALNFGVQLLWFFALMLMARLLWRSNLKRLVVQGG